MIRKGTKADYPRIEEHCAVFWKHAPYDCDYAEGSAVMYLDIAVQQGLLLVAEVDDDVIGFAAGCFTPMMGDSSVLIGTELAWWVDPEFRGGSLGIKLLKGLESAAKDAGCTYWNMIFMETSMPETVRSMYEKLGYELKETSYGKRL